jgi:ATP-binding cassette subfamily F protein 3
VHIDGQKLRRYSGTYSDFERQRAASIVLAAGQAEKQARERAHLESFIERFRAKATKARQAQSRMKMLAKMEDLAPLHVSAPFSFEFRDPLRSPDPLLVLDEVDAGYEGKSASKCVISKIKFSLQSGQRYGLLGVNGAGKSTFIKTVAGVQQPLAGTATFNKGLAVGYFAQHQLEMLDDAASPLLHLRRISPEIREQDLRNFLGMFNFPGEMALGPIATFSGGEKARLALALIVWQRPNLLLLDEPTNHLDLETREALTVALAQFEGTLVLVSHDRHLLRATTDQLLIVADGRLQEFDGDLDDYREQVIKAKLKPVEEKPKPVPKPSSKGAPSRKPLETRLKRLEEKIALLGGRKKEIESRLADPSSYAPGNEAAMRDMVADQAYAAQELAELEAQWLALQEELEQRA